VIRVTMFKMFSEAEWSKNRTGKL